MVPKASFWRMGRPTFASGGWSFGQRRLEVGELFTRFFGCCAIFREDGDMVATRISV